MKKHSKVGKKAGAPTFRTPSRFIAQKTFGPAKATLRRFGKRGTSR